MQTLKHYINDRIKHLNELLHRFPDRREFIHARIEELSAVLELIRDIDEE